MSHEIKPDCRYTDDHEWARVDGDLIVVGVTSYAVEQLGDITLVNLDVSDGDAVEKGKEFGTVESVKTLADLFSPVAGTVKKINDQLEDAPELVNDDCYGEGWLVAIEAPASAIDELLSPEAYQKLLDEA